jgi:hypothetical protein
MKTTLLCLFLLIFIVSCKNDPTAKEMVVVAADDSSSISLDIEVSTHGDTPVWVGKEIPEVENLLGVLDSVALNSISIAKEPIQSLDLKLFSRQFGLKKTDSEGILFLSEGNDSMRIVTIKERLAFLNLISLENVALTGFPVNELRIAEVKKRFPISYGVRNFYGDNYRANFFDRKFDSYDHVVLKISQTPYFLHLRFVDGQLEDLEINLEGIN